MKPIASRSLQRREDCFKHLHQVKQPTKVIARGPQRTLSMWSLSLSGECDGSVDLQF
ncbi:hypothetical protein Mapa_014564 [Marchantia paleacea]|nr:hypothetical protein Mapa_014564 [Marchantia paleacea]